MSYLITVSGPTSAGKNTLIEAAREKLESFSVPVSYTTRERREGEVAGVHYHYATRNTFERKLTSGDFIEHAEVHGNLYGTSREGLTQALMKGDVIFDLDVQGAMQLKKAFPDAHTVFIAAPLDELERRIRKRGKDDEASIARRLETARWELSQIDSFDWLIESVGLQPTIAEFLELVETIRSGREPLMMRFRNATVSRRYDALARA